jgi:prostaglandin E receptor 4
MAVSSHLDTTSGFTISVVNSTTQNLITSTKVYENIAPVTLLFFFGVVGNAVALCVLCCSSKTHKWRPFYRLVCGLAISDGGGILASYPFAEYRYISNFEYTFPKPLCDYLGFVFMFTLMSSAMIVCCMSFDRFFAIFYPFLYNTSTKNRRAMVMLGSVWTMSGIISSLHIYGLGSSRNYYPGSWCFLDFIDMSSTANVVYSYIYATSGAVVVILTIVINCLVILFFIKNKLSKSVVKNNRNDLPIVLFLLMIVTVFTSCWAPLMVRT